MHQIMSKVFLLICLSVLAQGVHYKPTWESLDARPLPSWYDEAKIGIFIHWGVFSVPSFQSEWFWYYWKGPKPVESFVQFMMKNYKPDWTYQDFAADFTAEFFDPNQWVEVFNASGARYVVQVTKHHEGFTSWPSAHSFNWNAKAVGPNRDLVGELSSAIRNKTKIHYGVYHSLFEWFNPLYLQDKANNFSTSDFVTSKTMLELYELVNKYRPDIVWSDGPMGGPDTYWHSKQFLAWLYNDSKFLISVFMNETVLQSKTLPELYELVNRYKPDVVWSDGSLGPDTYWHSKQFLTWLYNDSPVKDTVVVNDRWGYNCNCKHGGYFTCTDRYNPKTLQKHKWENAMTIFQGSWGYVRNGPLSRYMSIETLLTTLIQTVSCGGNILINVGPTKEGTIDPIFEERLRQMGSWLKVNGEAIYKTVPWRKQNDTINSDVWYTTTKDSPNTAYALVLKWPQNQLLLGAPVPSDSTSVTLLGYTQPLKWFAKGTSGMVIDVPTLSINEIPCLWAWVFKLTNVS